MEQILSWKIKKLYERSLKEHVDNREKERINLRWLIRKNRTL